MEELSAGAEDMSAQTTPQKRTHDHVVNGDLSGTKGLRWGVVDKDEGVDEDEHKEGDPQNDIGLEQRDLRQVVGKKRCRRIANKPTKAPSANHEETESPYSLEESQAIADLQDASLEDAQQYPHALKSFHQWMLSRPQRKSARNYTLVVSLLMRDHRKSITAMREERYYLWIKGSRENRMRNNIVSCALKQFLAFVGARGSADPPWEEEALPAETQYRVYRPKKKCTPKVSSEVLAQKTLERPKTRSSKLSSEQRQRIEHNRRVAMLLRMKVSPEQRQRIDKNRHAALLLRQRVAVAQWFTAAAPIEPTVAGVGSTLSPEQVERIETNRREAMRRREMRLQQCSG